MLAGRVDAADGEPGGDLQRTHRRLLEWLEGGQDLLAEVGRLGHDLAESRAAMQAAQRECERLRDDAALLRQDTDALRADNARLTADLTRLQHDRTHVESEMAALRSQNATLMDERGETARLIADKLEDMLAQVLPRLARPGVSLSDVVEAAAAAAPPPAAPAPPAADAPLAAGPVAEPDAPSFASPSDGPALGEAPADLPEPARVLVVDDEPNFTELLRDHLTTSGYETQTASSGEDALTAVTEFQPHVVLLDMMMAGIGGMETLRRIKAARSETSVVMITAIDDRDVARKALAAGASDYLTKPLSLDLLDSALALHVSGPRPAAPVELVTVAAPSGARRAHFVRT